MPSRTQERASKGNGRTSGGRGRSRAAAAVSARATAAQVEQTDEETQASAGEAYQTAGRLATATVNSWTALAQVSQSVNRELADLWTAGGQESWRLFGELQAASLGIAARAGGVMMPATPAETQQQLWAAGTEAYRRFSEELQARVEETTGKIQEAVNELAERVKNESRDARRANGRSSARR
jgi:hypothetical protein